MKKKTILVGLIMAVALMLAACGGAADSAPDEPQAADDSNASEPAKTGESTGEVQLEESGYCITEDNYIKYAFTIENASTNTAFEFPDITVTAYDTNGEVLATGNQMMGKIQPGEKQSFGSVMDCNGTKPDKVEFDIDTGEAQSPSEDAIKSSDFEISGTNERMDDIGGTSVTGKLKSNAARDTESVAVTVLFKKEGQIVSGTTTFVDNVGAGKEKAFEVTEYEVPEHDSYEVSALDWGY